MPDFTSHRTRMGATLKRRLLEGEIELLRPRPVRVRVALVATYLLTANVLVFVLTGCGSRVPPQVSINGRTWFVELAVTPEQHFKGLSGRMSLSPDTGMLFIFPDSAVRGFCMRGCYIPLDVAFIDADKRIVRITTMMVEADLAGRVAYSSEKPIKYALEVPAGAFRRSGVKAGDKVEFIGDIPNK